MDFTSFVFVSTFASTGIMFWCSHVIKKNTLPGYISTGDMQRKRKLSLGKVKREEIIKKYGRFSKEYYSQEFKHYTVDTRNWFRKRKDEKSQAVYLMGDRFTQEELKTIKPNSVYWDEYSMYYKAVHGVFPRGTTKEKENALTKYMEEHNQDGSLREYLVLRERQDYTESRNVRGGHQ